MEALVPFMVDASIRQVNRFAGASPVPQGDGSARAMDLALITGDQADNQQRNETEWVREILEGGSRISFNSGVTDPAFYSSPELLADPSCAAFLVSKGGDPETAAREAEGYTGVQDYDDYPLDPGNADPLFYDPDDPRGSWAAEGWPAYAGLLDRAQRIEIVPEGLAVPFYITNGNHDALVQGNEDAIAPFERIATGCTKVLGSTLDPASAGSLQDLLGAASQVMLVPPDPERHFVSKPQIKRIYGERGSEDERGFAFVDQAEREASNDSASYYAWDPPQIPGFRLISLDTVSEAGVLGPFGPQPTGSSDGNIDHPQFQWLERELERAQAENKLIVIFGHHPVRSMDANIPDELAAPCTVEDEHGHDVNPGCDLDPRPSTPIHLGDPETAAELGSDAKTFSELVAEYSNVVTYVPGHTHENRIIPFQKGDGGVWWEINSSAVIDYPQQQRLVEIFDNRDGTLSIFATVLDHAAPVGAPEPGEASGFGADELASIGRTFAFNDPQTGRDATAHEHPDEPPPPEGFAKDQKVELLIPDPRQAGDARQPGRPGASDRRLRSGEGERGRAPRCAGKAATIVGTADNDVLRGTSGPDVIAGLGGDDRIDGRGGRDLICAESGSDRVRGGKGRDTLLGGKGGDTLHGGRGGDALRGGGGNDLLIPGPGGDRCDGGPGRDRPRAGCGKLRRARALRR